MTVSLKKQLEGLDVQILNMNSKLDQLYDDKLNGILQESDFVRISQKYMKEREEIEEKVRNLTDQLQSLQGQQRIQNKNDEVKLNELISEFLQLKEVTKSYLFRLIDKIEIDKDKNVFISFNFAPLNTICDNIDEFVELERVLQEGNDYLSSSVG